MPAYQACARLGLSGRVAVADAKPRSNVLGDPDSWTWFSGFCLEGEVAKTYRVDDHDPDDGRLILNGLAPVTIFVGANNSGKSRMMRELFKRQSTTFVHLQGLTAAEFRGEEPASRYFELLDALCQEYDHSSAPASLPRSPGSLLGPDQDRHWFEVSTNAMILIQGLPKEQHESSESSDYWNNSVPIASSPSRTMQIFREIREHASRILDFPSLHRCYIPVLRGMRPPVSVAEDTRVVTESADVYRARTIAD